MAPSLRLIAAEVVRRAALRPGEGVLDIGTGTGVGAAAALGEGRSVVGVDAAPGMLAIARREVPAADFVEADFGALPFPGSSFDVVMAVHALHFADDPVAALAEWWRVVPLAAACRSRCQVPEGPSTTQSFTPSTGATGWSGESGFRP